MDFIIFGVVVIAVIAGLAIVVGREGRARSARGLVASLVAPAHKQVGVVVTSVEGRRVYLGMRLEIACGDDARLLASLEPIEDDPMSGFTRDERLVHDLCAAALDAIAETTIDASKADREPPSTLASPVSAALHDAGFEVLSIRMTAVAVLDQGAERLVDHWIGDCFRSASGGTPERLRAIELWLDGQRASPQLWADGVERGGGVVKARPSTAFVDHPESLCFAEAFVGAPIGVRKWMSFGEMMGI